MQQVYETDPSPPLLNGPMESSNICFNRGEQFIFFASELPAASCTVIL
jgi:hypothetical protein